MWCAHMPGRREKSVGLGNTLGFVEMSVPDHNCVVGRPAHVTIAIPGRDKAGEVVVRVRGGSEAYIAYADQPIEIGTEVVVVADRGARTLFVAPL